MDIISIFSERLNRARKEKNLTQRELAEKVGVTAATISAYEKGVKSPVLYTVIKLADTLTVSIDWLCGLSPFQEFNLNMLFNLLRDKKFIGHFSLMEKLLEKNEISETIFNDWLRGEALKYENNRK